MYNCLHGCQADRSLAKKLQCGRIAEEPRKESAEGFFLGFLSDWVVVGTSCCQHAWQLSDDFAVTVVFRWRGYKVSLCIHQAFTNMWCSYAYKYMEPLLTFGKC